MFDWRSEAGKASIQSKVKKLEEEFDLILAKRGEKQGNNLGQSATFKANKTEACPVFSERNPNARLFYIRWQTLVALPFIYGMAIPLIVLDLAVTAYQAICFRLFRIQRVRKADYIALERHDLGYLNFLERLNCDYCGYANGLIAFTREVLARTEQYFCPIKHAHKVLGVHERYAHFLKYGEANDYENKVNVLRAALAPPLSIETLSGK
jgi:hypothetical protein